MNDQDHEFDDIDERPRHPVPFFDVIKRQDESIFNAERLGKAIPDNARQRMKYVEAVLLHGNSGGRSNPTIMLPLPYTFLDVEAVLGQPDDFEPGSDASWRAIRRLFDSTHGGRLGDTGRTRG